MWTGPFVKLLRSPPNEKSPPYRYHTGHQVRSPADASRRSPPKVIARPPVPVFPPSPAPAPPPRNEYRGPPRSPIRITDKFDSLVQEPSDCLYSHVHPTRYPRDVNLEEYRRDQIREFKLVSSCVAARLGTEDRFPRARRLTRAGASAKLRQLARADAQPQEIRDDATEGGWDDDAKANRETRTQGPRALFGSSAADDGAGQALDDAKDNREARAQGPRALVGSSAADDGAGADGQDQMIDAEAESDDNEDEDEDEDETDDEEY